jgi:enoyl-CoA hydratase
MSPDSTSPAVLAERRARTLVVTLNRPEQRNAIDQAVADGVAAALDELDGDDALSVGVLTANGRGFCAGMDLKAFVAGADCTAGGRGFAGIVERPARKPLIAAVEGFAVAGGLEVALACDVIVAAEGAKLGLPEVKRALVATGGGLRRLPQRISFGLAMELALTGELITAERAHEAGLVDQLTTRGGTLERALELAEAIAVNGPLAIVATKRIMREQSSWNEDEFWSRQERIADPVMTSADAREGSVAFAEKRDPVWQRR